MNRIIKFKAWDTEHKMWLEYIKLSQNGIMMTAGDHKMIPIVHPERIKLLQYTGLKDKNGKEIYEGDIVYKAIDALFLTHIDTQFKMQIVFENGCFLAKGQVIRKGKVIDEDLKNFDNSWEVIGNIYEKEEEK